ncbi:MAG: hypothetical protein R3Y28_06905 [Candidatus Gastranaerophilales bacterium]
MDKIIYLVKKMKAFTFGEMLIISELEETELRQYLNDLVVEGVLKNTIHGYVYLEEDFRVFSKKQYELNKSLPIKTELTGDLKQYENKAWSEEDERFLAIIPEFNKKKYHKYMKLFLLTDYMNRRELMNFIELYNQRNPDDKTSYSSLMKARKNYMHYGARGIVGKYNNDRSHKHLEANEHFYKLFVQLYLSPLKPSYLTCMEEVAKCFDVDINTTPSRRRYKKYLLNNFSEYEIKNKRSTICF